jgi:hypothetical protein
MAISAQEAQSLLNSEIIRTSTGADSGLRKQIITANIGGRTYTRQQLVAAASQKKADVGTIATRSDSAIAKSKKPQADLGKQQTVATAGDTVPIVFCKRVSGVGGTWVQPALIKTGSNDFVGSFLYVVSQGQMVSSPAKVSTWVGTRSIMLLADAANISLTHYYASAATMASSPNSCPISSGNIFCGVDTYSYLTPLVGTSASVIAFPDGVNNYYKYNTITRGTGDTSNTIIKVNWANVSFQNTATGADVTATVNSYFGITNPSAVELIINGVYSGATLIGGHPVGTIRRIPASGYESPGANYWTINFGTDGPLAQSYTSGTVDNQANTSIAATDDTLDGDQDEIHLSAYSDPTSPPGSADFTVFSDITFLEIEGNIYDPPSQGSYPTTTRQISTYYENGITVDLYSGGLVSGSYATGASNQFVDLAMYMFTQIKRVSGATTADLAAPIDVSNLEALATFCTNTGLFFNGVIDQSVNTIDYISKTAPFFLLSFVSSNGRYSLQPLLPITGANAIDVSALTPAATFTEANILPGSFSKQYDDADERRAVNISLLWRETEPTIIGMQRTTTVRYATTDSNAPTVQFDMTDFCTSAAHATVYGKYELARRKYSTHSISFATPLLTTALIPTQIIRVTRQRITSSGDNRTETDWYQVANVKHESDGTSTISAMHFPVDGSSIAKISDEVVNGTFEVI